MTILDGQVCHGTKVSRQWLGQRGFVLAQDVSGPRIGGAYGPYRQVRWTASWILGRTDVFSSRKDWNSIGTQQIPSSRTARPIDVSAPQKISERKTSSMYRKAGQQDTIEHAITTSHQSKAKIGQHKGSHMLFDCLTKMRRSMASISSTARSLRRRSASDLRTTIPYC